MTTKTLEEVKELAKGYDLVPIQEEIFADLVTPIQLLRKIAAGKKNYYLLESVEGGEKWGRYSFLGYDPVMRVSCRENTVTIKQRQETKTVETDDCFQILRDILAEHKAPKIEGMPPFAGGFVGYFAYAMIAQAEKTLYITTPYLIITDEMSRALRLAAKRGVDVRIITPGIPDKKVVFAITRSYYSGLARQGVRIFEYTPGFCHAKQCLCDGKIASIGSSNFDYRSLYHHFENDVLLYGCDAIGDMARDFDVLFSQCTEVTQRYSTGSGAILRIWQCILRLFAPLV